MDLIRLSAHQEIKFLAYEALPWPKQAFASALWKVYLPAFYDVHTIPPDVRLPPLLHRELAIFLQTYLNSAILSFSHKFRFDQKPRQFFHKLIHQY